MAKKKAAVYDESSIQVIKDDIKRLQERYNMYIGYSQLKAFLHLLKEILQNSLDECMVEESTGDHVLIRYDEKTKIASVIDNGRGIPHGAIINAFTYIQSSGKFNKGEGSAYKYAAGENGVGGTATNALSNFMIVTSYRDGKSHTVHFKEGVPIEEKTEKCPKNQYGTTVTFQINEKYTGKFDGEQRKAVVELAETMAYLVPGVKISTEIFTAKGKVTHDSFKPKNGIIDLLNKMVGKAKVIDPIYFTDEAEDKTIEVALSYSPHMDETIQSFANYCTTVDHGTHVVGFRTGVSNVFGRFVRDEILSKTEKEKLQVTSDDVKSGLVAVVNARHTKAHFIGQVKEKIDNDDLVSFVRKATQEALTKWIKDNSAEAKRLGKYIKSVAKARLESQKVRATTIKSDMNIFSDDYPKNYKPATKRKGLELYIIEGESAGGGCNTGRDKKYQALYYLKGVPTNTYDLGLLKALNNEEIRGLVKVLGCGFGKDFDINKCRFEKIIILTDADVDGYRITSLTSTFFIKHMPQLVEAGMIYKAVPPLYKIKERKEDRYLKDNREYYNYIDQLISKKVTIKTHDGKKLSDEFITNLLYNNRQYLRKLTKLSNRFAVNATLLEHLVWLYGNDKALMKYLKQQKFLKVEKKKNDGFIITGIYDKEYQFVKLNDKMMNKLEDLREYIFDVNDGHLVFEVDGKQMTLGQLMQIVKGFEPDKKVRYKGLTKTSPLC